MRWVDKNQLCRLVDLSEIDAAKDKILTLCDDQESISQMIDDAIEKDKWSRLKESLWHLGQHKCWYSEAMLQKGEGHVEHYRPKKRLHGAEHQGYWWLAFDWTNYRLSHPTCNCRITDYLTGKKCGKGSYFPLVNEDQRAQFPGEESRENPILLDPTIAADTNLLCFDLSSGKPIPACTAEEDSEKNKRAYLSIDYYHLDEGTWNYKRKDLIDDVNVLCDSLEDVEAKTSQYDKLISEAAKLLAPHQEFLSVVIQTFKERGLLEQVS